MTITNNLINNMYYINDTYEAWDNDINDYDNFKNNAIDNIINDFENLKLYYYEWLEDTDDLEEKNILIDILRELESLN